MFNRSRVKSWMYLKSPVVVKKVPGTLVLSFSCYFSGLQGSWELLWDMKIFKGSLKTF